MLLDIKPAFWSVAVRSWPSLWKMAAFAAVGWWGGGVARAHYSGAYWWQTAPVLVALGVSAWRLVHELLLWYSRRYVLTDDHVRASSGILRRTTAEVATANIRQLVLDRPVLERATGLGTLCITGAGSQVIDVAWVMISRPEERMAKIRSAMSRAQNPGGDMLVIGLAGGVGSGKSEAARALSLKGFLVVDSDKEAKAALDRPEVLGQLVQWWGKGVVGDDGRVDRRAVAAIVFKDPAQRARLEGLVHPIVKADRAALVARARAEGKPGVVVDAPLLFEAGSHTECDAVMFIDSPRAARVERVKSRGWDEAELDRREKAQIPLEEKRRRSDIVVVNDADAPTLHRRVHEALIVLNARRRGMDRSNSPSGG